MINKRAYARLIPLFDGERSTHSAIAPLICFVFVFVIVVLLRLITIFGAVTAWCVEPDQFWYTSTGGNWPLIGTFFLVLFLLFVWNVFIGVDDWRHSRGTKVMVVVNAVAIASVFFVFNGIHDSATRLLHKRMGLFDNIHFQPWPVLVPQQTEDACVTARRFAGRYRVVEREVGHYGFDIPAEWIEIKPWGYVYAQDARWSETYAGRWLPPYKWEYEADGPWRYGVLFDEWWDFEVDGDTLILTTPADFGLEVYRSRVVLERIPIPDRPAYPNPHSAY